MKQIKENWKAIEAIEAEVRELTGDSEAGFNQNLYFIGPRQLMLSLQYRKRAPNGKWTKKVYEKMIAAKYCPFTGLPLYHENEDNHDQ